MPGHSLTVVSNRLPFTVTRHPDGHLTRQPAAGGLVTAVAPVVIQSQGVWVGWPGSQLQDGDKIPEPDNQDTSSTAGLRSSQVVPVHLSQEVSNIQQCFDK